MSDPRREPPDEQRLAALHRLADALRRTNDLLKGCEAPLGAIVDAANRAEATAAALEAATGERAPRTHPSLHIELYSHFSPLSGPGNALAPVGRTEVEGDRLVMHFRWGRAYEGPPGTAQGGYIAAMFDEAFGKAQGALAGSAALTAYVKVTYREAVPLHRDIRIEAWIDEVSGRKRMTRGQMLLGDRVLAEGEALFVEVSAERQKAKAREREGLPEG